MVAMAPDGPITLPAVIYCKGYGNDFFELLFLIPNLRSKNSTSPTTHGNGVSRIELQGSLMCHFLKLHGSPFVEARIRLICNLIILMFDAAGYPTKYHFFSETVLLNFHYKTTSSGRSAF